MRAKRRLRTQAPLQNVRVIPACALLEGVAALVIAEGLLVVGAILQRLAQRKTQVVSIRERGRRGCLLQTHLRDLLVRESIGLEVRQAPIGVTEARTRRGGGPVGSDRFGLSAECLERMADRHVQLRGLRGIYEELAEGSHRLLVISEANAGRGIHRAEGAIRWLNLEKLASFQERLRVLV